MKSIVFITCIGIMMLNFSQSIAQDSLHLIATMTGEKAGDEFANVAGAGDVNGDGYADILVGSVINYVKLYFGDAPFDTVAALKFFGSSHLGGVGDVNSDGFDDILIGVPGYPLNGTPRVGKAYLYFGGENMDTIPDFEFTGKYWGQAVGAMVAGAGDVNGDGIDDFMIGAPYAPGGFGRVFLFFGGTSLDTIPSITFISDQPEDFFGASGCGGGDINGDGFDDVIVGAPNYGGIGIDSGRVIIYYGGTEMDSIADVILYSKDKNFGKTCDKAGDLNNDGIDDFLISSLNNAYIYLGLDTCFVIHSSSTMGFGGEVNVGGGGDINNDDFDDFLIGNTTKRALVWGYYGGTFLDTLHDFSMEEETKGSAFSKNITIVGDINGDGFDEVGVGAPYFPDFQNDLGKVYIYSYDIGDKIEHGNNKNLPIFFKLYPNYPNPFNQRTRINFIIDRSEKVQLTIYTLLGKRVETLIDDKMDSGLHSIIWEANELPSGIYLCRVSTGEYSDTIKLLLIN